uniref:Dolichyl-phosphate beta-glucosyltransferase n=1 Tax=Strigamia maritima TaxID=126957 RepID=T1JCG4_STRMM
MSNIDLDDAVEKAEVFCLELVSQCPPKLKGQQSTTKWKSIHQKLTDLYMEECAKEPKQKVNLRSTSNLLEKLIAREKLNFLIVNLYPGNDGYSLMLKGGGGRTGVDTETMRLSYEESELLQCINNEELPPILVDLLDRSQVHIFYSGCVIAEIRDFRRSNSSATYDCHHVLLKPTLQTLLCDLNTITNDNTKWAPEDKQLLESQLILVTQEPLCLSPSHTVAVVANRLQYNLNKFSPLNKVAKKWSQVVLNRKRKFEQSPAPICLQLHDFIKKRNQVKERIASNKFRKFTDVWKEYPMELACPETIEVEKQVKQVKPVARPKTPDFDVLVLVEEYLFESEPHVGKISHTHLTVKRFPIEEVYVCELYIDKDYVEGEEKGATYNFNFKSRDLVDKYINQFTEIVTEEGRKSVKITHMLPGHPPKVTNSQSGMNEVLGTMPQTSLSATVPAPKQTNRILAPLSISNITNSSNTNANTNSNTSTVTQMPIANRSLPRQVSLLGSNSRPASASPGPPNVTSPGLLPSYSQAVSLASAAKSAPTPPPLTRTPTPRSTPTPPARTPPPRNTTPGPRRPPSTDNYVPTVTTPTPMSASVGQLGLISSVPLGLAGILTAGSADTNATLTPPMSIAGVPMSSGIAVPISLAMMHATQQSNIMSSATAPGVLVNPVSGLMGTTALAGSPAHGPSTMTTTVSTMSGPAVIVTSGMLTTSSPVLATHANMLPLPLGISGTFNQLMTSGLKNAPGLRPAPAGQPLSLLQVASSGQPTLSLFSQIHRPLNAAQAKASGQLAASLQRSVTPSPPSQGPTPPPNVTVTSPVMTTLLPQQQAILAYQKQASSGQLCVILYMTSSAETKIIRHEDEKYFTDPMSNSRRSFPSLEEPGSVHLSVIVPAYNEEMRLPKMLNECLDYLEMKIKEKSSFSYEVIIVDDGSKDSTTQIGLKYSKQFGCNKIRVLTLVNNRGKGGAVKLGLLSARGEYLLFADADGATKFSELDKLKTCIEKMTKNPEIDEKIVVGSRAHLEQESVVQRSIFRTFLMYGFHFLVWFFCVRNVKDTQCGFKLFTRASVRSCFHNLHIERWAFDVELLYIAEELKVQTEEIAVDWTEIEGSKVVPFWSWLEMGRDLLLI